MTSTGIHQTKLLRFGDHFLYSLGLNDKIMFGNLYCTDINISFSAAHQRFSNVTVRRQDTSPFFSKNMQINFVRAEFSGDIYNFSTMAGLEKIMNLTGQMKTGVGKRVL